MFDWIDFLNSYGVEYIEVGPNVSRGNVNVRCPLCQDDPSFHLGISLNGQGWGCWRDSAHRGKSSKRLVQLLIGCTPDRAARIVGSSLSLPNDLNGSVAALLAPQEVEEKPRPSMKLPKEFLAFKDVPSSRLFRAYLNKRGYTDKQINRFTKKYGMCYCTKGVFRGRIIFPIIHEGELVNWTGRTIYPNEELRYKTLTTKADRASVQGLDPAKGNISKYLLWYDDIYGGQHDGTLVIVEGPFDALKIRVLGNKLGVTATCFFTSMPSSTQVGLMHKLFPKFKNRCLLLDQGTQSKALRLEKTFGESFSGLGIDVKYLPEGVDDPGDLTKKDFISLFPS